MSHIFFKYDIDGETKWGIWSTIVDAVVAYNMTAAELIEYEADEARRKRAEAVSRQIEDINNGQATRRLLFMPDDVEERAKECHK